LSSLTIYNVATKKEKREVVLLVEDDQFLQKILSQRLIEEGINIEVAGDGEAAVKAIRELKPKLVLLDLILPKMNGFEVLAEIITDPVSAKLSVVVLSNLGQQEDKEHMETLGVKDYLVKADYSLSEMVNKVKEYLK